MIRAAPAAVLVGFSLLQDVLTAAGAGALVGGAVAYLHERRVAACDRVDRHARWTWWGAALGVVIHLVAEVA